MVRVRSMGWEGRAVGRAQSSLTNIDAFGLRKRVTAAVHHGMFEWAETTMCQLRQSGLCVVVCVAWFRGAVSRGCPVL